MPSDPPPTQLTDELLPIAAELIGCVHDYGPAEVEAVLARVPDGRHDALAVVLAAMVDPDATPVELLSWLETPVQSRDNDIRLADAATLTPGRRGERRSEIARLTELGLPASVIADRLRITKRSVERHRAVLRGDARTAA